MVAELLPPELLAQLQALLAAAEMGNIAEAERLASSAELREFLNRLAADPDLLKKLAAALAAQDPNEGADRQGAQGAGGARAQSRRHGLHVAGHARCAREDGRRGRTVAGRTAERRKRRGTSRRAPRPRRKATPRRQRGGQHAGALGADGAAGRCRRRRGDHDDVQPRRPEHRPSRLRRRRLRLAGGRGRGRDGARGRVQPRDWSRPARTIPATTSRPRSAARPNRARRQSRSRSGAAGQFDKSRAAAPPPVPEARRSGVQTLFRPEAQ